MAYEQMEFEEMEFEEHAVVYSTTDYDLFNVIDGNRLIKQLHADKLAESMSEKQLLTPIIVNERFEIIDGQHRFIAIRKLGLPVYFIVCEGYGLADVHRLNERSHDWKLRDFLEGYAVFAQKNDNYKDYIILKKFIEENHITPAMAIFLTKGDKNEQDATLEFKNGLFKVKDLRSAQEFLNRLEDFAIHFQDRYKTAVFMRAFKIFSSSRKYSHENMVKKLEYMGGMLQNRSNIGQYIELLCDIYNTRVNEKNRIHFKGEKELVA